MIDVSEDKYMGLFFENIHIRKNEQVDTFSNGAYDILK